MHPVNRERSWQLAPKGFRTALTSCGLSLVLGASLSTGCGSTTNVRSGIAAVCSVNSDCDSPLVCTFGLCHVACRATSDCVGKARCVASNGVGVCQLDDEATCTYDSQCSPPLACAGDGQCRNECKTARDCLRDQVCTPSGSCADSAEVNQNGELKNASVTPDAGTHGGSTDGTGGRSGATKDAGAGGSFVGGGGAPGAGGGKDFGAGGGPTGMPGCGHVDEPCCGAEQSCPAPGALCFQGRCVSCGELSGQCCDGDTCTSASATCANGTCVSCGAQGKPCCGSTCDATLACSSGICDVPCTAPYVARGGVCVALPPRPIAPLSGSNVGTRSPKLSWALPSGIPAAHVDVCKDRACTNVLFTKEVTGTSVVVGATLPPGTAFWRLRASDALGTIDGPVWQVQIGGTHDAPLSTAWGAVPDFDGDGHADVVMQTASGASMGTRVYSGTATGLASTFVTLTSNGGGGGNSTFAVSDLDGDGFVDLVLPMGPGIAVYPGKKTGISLTSSQTINGTSAGENNQTAGDVNGDGYGDLVVPTRQDDGQGNSFLAMNVYSGGPSGLSISPQSFTTAILHQPGFGGSDTGDVNGDGFSDVIVASTSSGGMGGTAAVFYGGPSGLSTSPTTIPVTNTPGFSVSCAGDVNGDGYDDMLIVTTTTVTVYHGGAGGLSTTSAGSASTFGQPGKSQSNQLGLGDANGDGYSDIVVPASSPPGLRVFLGSATGLQTGAGVALQPTAPASFVVSSATIESLSALGDVDGDGFADLGLGVDWTSQSQIHNHQAYVFSGGASVSTAPSAMFSLATNGMR